MGIVQRFERKLQRSVGDAFARAFGGSVVPAEVEAALRSEAADHVQELEGGHRLAPNSYVITINSSDHEHLASDNDLTSRAFARHLEDYIREQGWQTYGSIHVEFEASPTLHTGQFRTRGLVDPDAGRHPPSPTVRATPQPGAGRMTQNSGYDADRPDDPRYGYPPAGYQNGARPDYSRGGEVPPRNGQPRSGYQNGYDRQEQRPAGYRDPERSGYRPDYADQGYAEQGYADQQQQGYAAEPAGYDQQGYANQAYQDQGYADQGYAEPGYAPDQGYAQPAGYDQQSGYADQGYQQRGAYAPPTEAASYGAPAAGYAQAGSTYSATLQLDDGSGRTYQLREGANVIGRGQEANFRLPDTGVSRRHIEVRWDGQVAMLSDLGSTNGTTVNGAPVQDWQLADGDVIRAGHSEILIRIV